MAWDVKTGRERWRFGRRRSSPRRCCGTGASTWAPGTTTSTRWTRRRGGKIWSFQGDEQMNTGAAYWRRTIYIASDGGTLYALNARTGKLRWSAQSNSKFGSREFFYATPTVAYGRVYIGNTDGTMYVFGAKTGNLLWARPLGSYIYGAAAVAKRRVFVGTYDGRFYALDAATGDTDWQIEAPGAVHARAHGDERDRLLRHLLELRLGGAAHGQARAPTARSGCAATNGRGSGASAAASTRTRWWRTRSGSTSRAGRRSTRSPRGERGGEGREAGEEGEAAAMSTATAAPVMGHTR